MIDNIYYTLFVVSTDFNKEMPLVIMAEIEVCNSLKIKKIVTTILDVNFLVQTALTRFRASFTCH